jgi:CRISPR type I-E-associated protein CasB/Cse2
MSQPISDGKRFDYRAAIHKLAYIVTGENAHVTKGDVAEFKRMKPEEPSAAFFKLLGLTLDKDLPGEATQRMEAETNWAAVLIGLVHLGKFHMPGVRTGAALARSGYSELRMVRLLKGDRLYLLEEMLRLAKFLANKGVAVDWSQIADLLLGEGFEREKIRRALARDYYQSNED